MTIEECYRDMGADYSDVFRRLGKAERVKRFLLKLPEEKSYSELCKAMKTDNLELAFRSAHSLKGVCTNLGLTQLYSSSSQLTDALRNMSWKEELEPLFLQVQQDYQRTVNCIQQFTQSYGEA